MAGLPTRSSTRQAAIKTDTASVPSDDGVMSDATAEETPPATATPGSRSSYSQAQTTSARERSSRLSEEVEPMNLDDDQRQSADDIISHDEIDPLGQDVKEAAAMLSRLEGLGLQKFDISLPRCIVLGQQSTGKSSVIEAISGIKTPRDTDTCTSCPLYINLKPSSNPGDKWTARVSLLREFMPDLRPKTKKGTKEPFPGWVAATSSQIPFAETQSRVDLENIIRSAQSANLNPHVDPQTFLAIGTSAPRSGPQQNKFSPNTVCIDIMEPGLPSLSFFDLPGIIAQAETEEEEYTVALVRNLVGQYVQEEGSLILVTCDLGTDIANSTAAGLARKHEATNRCIGVLTKPDLVAPGTTDQSLCNVLNGSRFPLGHGYFVVKNLNKQEIASGLGHREARLQEAEFFSNGRWADTLHPFQSRFGTKNLQLYLSRELAKRTFTRLPGIYEQITTQLDQIEEDLKGIPVTPGHSAVRAIADHILDFTQEVRSEMEGAHGYTIWWNTWEMLQKGFKDAIMAMKPSMRLKGELDAGIYAATLPGTSADDAVMINSDEEDDTDVSTGNTQPSPSKKRKVEPSPVPPQLKTPVRTTKRQPMSTPTPWSKEKQTPSMRPTPESFSQYRKTFILDDVVREISRSSKSKVPDQIHPKVRETMIIQPLEEWHRPTELFFSTLEEKLMSRMESLFTKHFAKRQGTELFRNGWKIVHEILRNNVNSQQTTMAQETLIDELEGPYTFHRELFDQEKAAVREMYRRHRSRIRFDVFLVEAKEHLHQDMNQKEQDRVRKDQARMAVINNEPYDTVIDLIAEVTGYYNLAARRFHDSICMRVQSKFFKQLRDQLREELESGLGVHDEKDGMTTAQRLLAESPEHELRRQQLLTRKEALTRGLDCLKELRDKYSGAPSGAAHGFGREGSGPSMVTHPAEEM